MYKVVCDICGFAAIFNSATIGSTGYRARKDGWTVRYEETRVGKKYYCPIHKKDSLLQERLK